MNSTIKLQMQLDDASQYLEALCDLLTAASDSKLHASALLTVLKPISAQLNLVAGQLSDEALRQPK